MNRAPLLRKAIRGARLKPGDLRLRILLDPADPNVRDMPCPAARSESSKVMLTLGMSAKYLVAFLAGSR